MSYSTSFQSTQMIGLTHAEIFVKFAEFLSNEPIAIINIHYPEVDERNHKSLDTLVAALSGHGFSEVAELVEKQIPVLVTRDLAKASKVLHEIQRDSVAISATLYFKGLFGLKAEQVMYAELKGV